MAEDLRHLLPLRVVAVPIDELDQLKRDPVGYLTRKGATPITSAHPFYNDRESIRNATDPSLKNHVDDKTHRWVGGEVRNIEASRYIHIDLGLSKDATGIACCHVRRTLGSLPVIEFDFIARLVPPKGHQIRIDDVEQIIYDMDAAGYTVALITADRFGSDQMLQHFNEAGYNAAKLSVDRTTTKTIVKTGDIHRVSTAGDHAAAHMSLKLALADGRVFWPEYYPLRVIMQADGEDVEISEEILKQTNRTWLEQELLQMQTDPTTRLVVKPPGGTDDLAQAVAGACFNCTVNETEGGEEALEQRRSAAQVHADPFYRKLHEHVDKIKRSTAQIEAEMKFLDPDEVPEDPFYDSGPNPFDETGGL